jgi:CitMHS family citrate-Mg2+:H+ or citrate-Ca2+:H+ symporter
MNMLPWAGPTTRAAAVVQVSPAQIYMPLVIANIAGLATVFALAARLGVRERRRLARGAGRRLGTGDQPWRAPQAPDSEPVREAEPASSALPRLWFVNATLTLVTLVALVLELLPLPVVFLVACAIALLINYPNPREQRERFTAHAAAAMMMVTIILAAGVFIGIVKDSGMLGALAGGLVAVLPGAVLSHLPIALGVASMPLSLAFDPDSFYFGVLPVLAQAAEAAGGSAISVGRAAVLGQMTTGFPVSPLTPATFLLVGLAGVDLVDHQRRTIPYLFAITLVMTAVAAATGALGGG